jgi:hypothetical protein
VVGEDERYWSRETHTFVPLHKWREADGPLFEGMFDSLVQRARRFADLEAESRTTTHAISALVAATANLRAARTGLRLTIAATALTIIATFLSYLALPNAAQQIRDLFR